MKSSKKPIRVEKNKVCSLVTYNVSNDKNTKRLEGEEMLKHVQIYAPVKIKGYTYAF